MIAHKGAMFFLLKMPVNLSQCWGTIGVFNASITMIKIKNRPISRLYFFCNTNQGSINIYFFLVLFLSVLLYYFHKNKPKISFVCTGLIFCSLYGTVLWLCELKMSLSSDIEINPGPAQKNQNKSFSICHWNLNIITAYGYAKVSLLKACITARKIDIIRSSESYLDSTIQSDNLEIPEHNLVRSDHPSNNKRGAVCIYYKASLPLRVILICFLQECITFEVMIGDKQCNFVALCSSPSQNQDKFDYFSKSLEITLDKLALNNPFMLVVIADLNAKSQNWYPLDRTTYEGNIIETITSHFGLHQLIHDPTHILEKSSSCIDLIFTSQPNMVVNSGVHSSLHANCHHQIVFAKFGLKVYHPPPYEHEV